MQSGAQIVGGQGGKRTGQRENEGGSSLCTSLIQHCQGTDFYFSLAEEGTVARGASI